MRIPKSLNLEEFKLFILQIAEKVGARITAVKFNPLLMNAGGLAYLDDSIELRIPLRKKYNPQRYLHTIIHEIAHLKQRQEQKKWGHQGLLTVIQGIYQSLGWTIGTLYSVEEHYCRTEAQKES